MDIGIVGAGKVGCSIGKYLREQDIPVAGYFSKTKESVESAATFTETKAFNSLAELLAASDILFITTPDDCISEVWHRLAKESIQDKIICHFSGSLSSVVFSDMEQTGAFGCSIHPMYAFSSKFTSYEKLNQVLFTVEGHKQALAVIKPLLEKAGNRVCVIPPEKKVRYHAAASMVSNMMIGLYQLGLEMLMDCGFEAETAKTLIEPLVRGNLEAVLETSPEQALTGPIERNDKNTVEKHLTELTEKEKQVYVNLGGVLAEIAGRKNPDRDYTAIIKTLWNGGKNEEHSCDIFAGEGEGRKADDADGI
ncbi:MAG: prephenate dehydrogenase/arogenate dehydrogenase family protein [Lachnospiraceae bacterium]|nr:prephenate dehydrogenase/arogenate dehydrogenase family protein [Lachnospiraceae bacterium]